jgi:S1-C subfamily serine protease
VKLANETGLMILGVEAGGPAEKAGVLIGDILVALNGKPLTDTEELAAHLSSEQIGKSVKASLVRGGTLINLDIPVEERPAGHGQGRTFQGGWRRGRWHRGH